MRTACAGDRSHVTATVGPRSRIDRNVGLAAAAAYLALGWRSRRSVGRAERGLFARFNHPTEVVPVLRLPQRLGTPWVLPGTAVLGAATGRLRLAVDAAVALPLQMAAERGMKRLLARPRPAQVDHGSVQRDGAPADGPSYPSGHAARAFAAAGLGAPHLPPPWRAVGFLLATVASAARVRQGAHFPGDAVGGALLGVAVASILRRASSADEAAR
jgi:membrane-associated phospholipid phosphatase